MLKRTLLLVSFGLVLVTGWGFHPASAEPVYAADEVIRDKYTPTRDEVAQAYQRAYSLPAKLRVPLFKTQIAPHWLADNARFWYRNDLRDGVKEFILVDAEHGVRTTAFDHKKLAAALSEAAKKEYHADKLPFDAIEFPDARTLQFEAGRVVWKCDLTTYECTKVNDTSGKPAADRFGPDVELQSEDVPLEPEAPFAELQPRPRDGTFAPRPEKSPDGKWTATIRDYNVFLRAKDATQETQLTKNGEAGNAFRSVEWSPDSKTLVAIRMEPGDNKEVYLIESSPRDQLAAKLTTRPYPRPGDKLPAREIWLADVDAKKPIKVDAERIDYGRPPQLRWLKDGQHFLYAKTDRGHQRFRVIEVDVLTGQTRTIIDEKAETFVDHYTRTLFPNGEAFTYLERTDEIVYQSERDGWKHLYLIDARAGKVRNQITKGAWVARGVDKVDEDARQIWFRASGLIADQDPYVMHYCRINFDGSGMVDFTPGDGTHAVKYSPDRKYVIDTYSRVDLAPVHELRRVADGSLVCDLEKADVAPLREAGWTYPEVFHAKGRDDQTDIWGIVCRPQHFDASKKYPVIEYIYAGPHDSHVPKSFAAYRGMQSLAELGFIVVQIDGMGTANRSRAFHDVCWKNLADAGFPDRIRWIKALAARYPYIDTDRVGIHGTSAGGQNALGALLFHGDFYKVAVASCGCHDNRLDKASWNEAWMGVLGPHYTEQSNVTNAGKLHGKLLLMVGELDTNVPPESTLRVVDALIKANKDFDFLVFPGLNHTDGGVYGERRRRDFFVRHLLGVEPPERNGGSAAEEPRTK